MLLERDPVSSGRPRVAASRNTSAQQARDSQRPESGEDIGEIAESLPEQDDRADGLKGLGARGRAAGPTDLPIQRRRGDGFSSWTMEELILEAELQVVNARHA